MKKLMILALSLFAWHAKAQIQDTGQMRYLYANKEIPGASKPINELEEREKPKLYVHQTDHSNGNNLVFLVIPGGGYGMVAINHEGHDIAKRLNDNGYDAYVLEYRLPNPATMVDKKFGPLQDAQYALATIRKENPKKKVAVIGFSAGGHLAASLSTLYKHPTLKELKKVNLRPDYSVLCYPVISMDDAITHKGSKQNLIGPEYFPKDVELFSTEKQINGKSQPTFLMSAEDDKVVPIENSLRYQENLKNHKIPNELFTYKEGGHGFGLVNKTDNRDWFGAMLKWIENLENKKK